MRFHQWLQWFSYSYQNHNIKSICLLLLSFFSKGTLEATILSKLKIKCSLWFVLTRHRTPQGLLFRNRGQHWFVLLAALRYLQLYSVGFQKLQSLLEVLDVSDAALLLQWWSPVILPVWFDVSLVVMLDIEELSSQFVVVFFLGQHVDIVLETLEEALQSLVLITQVGYFLIFRTDYIGELLELRE